MRLRHLLRAAVAALAVVAAPAIAQNCVGFTDVPASSPFCPSVEWMKNRGITLGCGAGTTYCPNDAVSRLGMAAFLQRVGDKLTPTILPVVAVDSAVQHNLASPVVVCPTGDYVVLNYPRRALFTGRVNLYNPSANGDFISEMVYDDDGLGWKAVQNSAAYQTLYAGMSPAHDVSTYPQGYLDLDVGKTYKFGMRISRYTGTTANVASYCVNMLSIANRNGVASPYDDGSYTPPADAMPPTGRAAPRQ
jgi:hypothetical protein